MYVRGAKKHEEAWLLDRIDDLGLADRAFRSRDYAVAIDESSGEIAGFGRLRVHSDDPDDYCEVTTLGVLPAYREQGVGAHVVERLVERARDRGFEAVYSLTNTGEYLTQFGFEAIEDDELPGKLRERLATIRDEEGSATAYRLSVSAFGMPHRLRTRFKRIGDEIEEEETEDRPEDFGIDPESATYKYDTGR